MGRKVLSKEQENTICLLFNNQVATVKGIAHRMGCSVRTIDRVLVEKGYKVSRAAHVDQQLAELRDLKHLLKKYNMLHTSRLEQVLKDHAAGQKQLPFAGVQPKVLTAAPMVNAGTTFCLSMVAEQQHVTVVISHKEGDTIIMDHQEMHSLGETTSFFKLNLKPAELTMENVQAFLNDRTTAELAGLFYASGLVKIAEIHNSSVMASTLKHQQRAATLKQEQQQKEKVSYAIKPNYKAS